MLVLLLLLAMSEHSQLLSMHGCHCSISSALSLCICNACKYCANGKCCSVL
jgi:hypothetical protein